MKAWLPSGWRSSMRMRNGISSFSALKMLMIALSSGCAVSTVASL
ncbi:Uncharacterised protein [Klebsiella pneumoniae]|nr:Uncharacterised protein [Klebsiella pneumoniae]